MKEARRAALCGVLVGIVSLGFYVATLAPGLTWAHGSGDGGEMAAAAKTLGIPHPPGYPAYTLVAHLFTLLPVGEVATRTNLFSAACGAGAAGVLAWTLAQMGCRWASVVSAGLSLAFSPLLWSQAVVTEVHAFGALIAALLLGLGAVAERGGTLRGRQASTLALLIGGLWGVGCANQPTAVFLGPLALLSLWRLRRGLLGAAGVVLGLCLYLYLPLRAAASPPVNWGNPQTTEQFWWVVSGGPYRQFVFSLPLRHLPERLLAWSGLLREQFGWAGLLVTVLGAAACWGTDRLRMVATGASAVLFSAFAIGYDTSDSYLYLIPALVCAGIWLGLGVDWLLRTVTAEGRRAAGTAAAVAVVLPLVAAVWRMPAQDLGDDQAAVEFGTRILGQAPLAGVILSREDAHTFALWYYQHALGRRPDVVTVDLDLLGFEWYAAQVSRRLERDAVDLVRTGMGEDLERVARVAGRPVCRVDVEGTGLRCAVPGAE